MTPIKPGQPVRGSRSGRPIMVLLDLLGRRWTLRVIWELHDGALGFRELQARCDNMSSSVLSRRLVDLLEAGITAQDEQGRYWMTDEGMLLVESLKELNNWAERWAQRQV